MDFLAYLRHDVSRWVLGQDEPGEPLTRCGALFDALYLAIVGEALERHEAHRRAQRPLWRRLEESEPSPTAPVWIAANRAQPSRGVGLLRWDAHKAEVEAGWTRLEGTWPGTMGRDIAAAPEHLQGLMALVPRTIAARGFLALAGLAVAETTPHQALLKAADDVLASLPHSVREDERALGKMQRRALWAATMLGGIGGNPDLSRLRQVARAPTPSRGALGEVYDALFWAQRRQDLDLEIEVLELAVPYLEALEMDRQADAATILAVATALARGEANRASRWLHHLALAAEARGDLPRALRLQRLRSGTAIDVGLRSDALRRGAELALQLDRPSEALALLRGEAALQDGAGDAGLAGLAWLNIAKLLSAQEAWEDAEATAGEATRRLLEVGTLGLARQALVLRAEALTALGQPSSSLECLEQARDLAVEEGQPEVAAALRTRVEAEARG